MSRATSVRNQTYTETIVLIVSCAGDEGGVKGEPSQMPDDDDDDPENRYGPKTNNNNNNKQKPQTVCGYIRSQLHLCTIQARPLCMDFNRRVEAFGQTKQKALP